MPYIIWTIFATTIVMNNIVRDTGKYWKLPPFGGDGARGLGIFGNVALSIYFIILLPTISSVISIYALGWTQIAQTMVPVYLGFLIILFFLPLWSCHRCMVRYKGREIGRFMQEYDQKYLKDGGMIGHHDKDDHNIISYQVDLKKMIDDINDYPEWPFNTPTIRLFFSTTGAVALSLVPNFL